MNVNRLKGHIMMYGESQRELADAMGISESALSLKIIGKYEFKRSEIEFIALRYKLGHSEIQKIFFPDIEEVVACVE